MHRGGPFCLSSGLVLSMRAPLSVIFPLTPYFWSSGAVSRLCGIFHVSSFLFLFLFSFLLSCPCSRERAPVPVFRPSMRPAPRASAAPSHLLPLILRRVVVCSLIQQAKAPLGLPTHEMGLILKCSDVRLKTRALRSWTR